MQYQYRQGDIFLKKVDIIEELDEEFNSTSLDGKEVKNAIILALGEVTGHAHAIRFKDRKQLRRASLARSKHHNRHYLRVSDTVYLTHEEHSKITIPAGDYEVIRQREYFPGKIIQVAD